MVDELYLIIVFHILERILRRGKIGVFEILKQNERLTRLDVIAFFHQHLFDLARVLGGDGIGHVCLDRAASGDTGFDLTVTGILSRYFGKRPVEYGIGKES